MTFKILSAYAKCSQNVIFLTHNLQVLQYACSKFRIPDRRFNLNLQIETFPTVECPVSDHPKMPSLVGHLHAVDNCSQEVRNNYSDLTANLLVFWKTDHR